MTKQEEFIISVNNNDFKNVVFLLQDKIPEIFDIDIPNIFDIF